MQVFLLGVNHKTAPVEVRETLSPTASRLPRVLRWLRRAGGLREIAVLSTCNRAEVYAVGTPAAAAQLEILLHQFHAVHARIPAHDIDRCLYREYDAGAARHLFRVASGLDSLVLGESEILGQVKGALATARTHGAAGDVLDELFRRAIGCGKRARTETMIGRGALNVGSTAVALARKIFGPLSGHTVLILGAGKMSALTAQCLVSSGARRIIVANRTWERAQELASTFGDVSHNPAIATAARWDELPQRLIEADIVISSTRAPHLVLDARQVAVAMKARRHRPLFLIDIAVPRDIDPAVQQLDDVFLYDIDDLQKEVATNLAERAGEATRVETIIDEEVQGWTKWQRGRDTQPVLAALARRANAVRDAEVESALARMPELSPRQQEIVRAMAKSIAQKLMHPPLRHLREAAGEGSPDVEALRRAFALDAEIEPSNDVTLQAGEIEAQYPPNALNGTTASQDAHLKTGTTSMQHARRTS